jgi:LemA protein
MSSQVLIIGLVVLIIAVILMYNSLIYRKNQIENAEGAIDAYLKQRYDLIPNLVESVKAYMKHEKEILEEITKLRTLAMNAKNFDDKVEYESKLTALLDRLMVNVENYPQLKANENFLQLQNTLTELENSIAAARRAYNQAVTDYNNAIEMFPTNIIASFMKLKRRKVFEIPENERKNIDLGNLFKK